MRPCLLLFSLLLSAPVAGAELPPAVTGELYVSDHANDRVVVYDASGAYLRDFTAAGLSGPRGIVFAPNGSIYVASEFSDEVLRFDAGEALLARYAAAELDGPTGMAISPAGELHVSSFNNARICVFTLDGTFQRSYTAPTFNTPNCVMFDAAGNIYSSSASRAAIYKFDPAETFLTAFTAPASGLLSPMGIAHDESGVLYVAGGGSHNIVKFQTDGTYLGELTHPDLTGPQGVAFDERGHLFSPSFFQDRIVEFDAAEAYVQTITAGGLSVPRTVAFAPARSAVRNGLGCNPVGFVQHSLPMVGASWLTSVDVATPGAIASVVALGFGGPSQGFKLSWGELLCLPPYALDVAVGAHSLAVPADPGLVGTTVSAQAATYAPGDIRLNNAIDATIGAY